MFGLGKKDEPAPQPKVIDEVLPEATNPQPEQYNVKFDILYGGVPHAGTSAFAAIGLTAREAFDQCEEFLTSTYPGCHGTMKIVLERGIG